MDSSEPHLFSTAAATVLGGMPFDPMARSSLEIMSGGLMWPDEFPRLGTPEWALIAPGCLYRYLLAYRASITLHPEQRKFLAVWDQVVEHAPNWPGLRPERRDEPAARRLRAALRRQDKCLAELEKQLESDNPSTLLKTKISCRVVHQRTANRQPIKRCLNVENRIQHLWSRSAQCAIIAAATGVGVGCRRRAGG